MKSQLFRFRDFQVYKDLRIFRTEIKAIKFPEVENFILKSQLWRATDSVLLNIAEGSEKYSDVDFSRFLNTSVGSFSEVIACLDLALDDKYIDQIQYNHLIEKGVVIYKQLRAFSSKVRKDKVKN